MKIALFMPDFFFHELLECPNFVKICREFTHRSNLHQNKFEFFVTSFVVQAAVLFTGLRDGLPVL